MKRRAISAIINGSAERRTGRLITVIRETMNVHALFLPAT